MNNDTQQLIIKQHLLKEELKALTKEIKAKLEDESGQMSMTLTLKKAPVKAA